MPTLCLSFHADYRCRHSGACCTSGWPIPVEPAQRARLEAALASGTLTPGCRGPASTADSDRDCCSCQPSDWRSTPFVDGAVLPDGSSILRVLPSGACSCYDPNARRCLIHAHLGHDALPVSCQHFPRVCLIDREATYVTLSHYCPTAARMLLSAPGQKLGATPVVEAPPAFAPLTLEGLDARDVLPPLLRPRMLADREGYRQWEREVLAVLDRDMLPEAALARIIDATEKVRRWEPGHGLLRKAVVRAFEASGERRVPRNGSRLSAAALRFDALVRQCVPEGLGVRPPPPSALGADAAWVVPVWPSFAAPLRRYLAAKIFATWVAYQGRGLRTIACSLVAALSVLRVEAARHCAAARRELDEPLLVEAFRSADLLLVHLVSREELSRRFSEVEEEGVKEMRDVAELRDV